MLQHHAGGIVLDNLADHRRCHHHRERQRVVLDHEGDVGADRLDRLGVIAGDLVVGAERGRRGDHHAAGAEIHHLPGERAHRGEARRRDADDDRLSPHPRHGPLDQLHGFLRLQLGRLAHDAEHRDAVRADAVIEFEQPVGRGPVDRAVRVERRRRDREDATGGGCQAHAALLGPGK
ncbi:hypothetical protein D3C87_1614680 [compost metagenome]